MEIPGVLEIDHERGVVYFHTDDSKALKVYGATTILRICGLGKIPKKAMDVTLRPKEQLNTDVCAIVAYST